MDNEITGFHRLQEVTDDWRQHNFPVYQRDYETERELATIGAIENFIGMVEELGELAHAFLKQFQGIRTDENLGRKETDAIGDLMIYLCGYCSRRGISLEECVNMAWWEVKDRDWIKWPGTGRPAGSVSDGVRDAEDEGEPLVRRAFDPDR